MDGSYPLLGINKKDFNEEQTYNVPLKSIPTKKKLLIK